VGIARQKEYPKNHSSLGVYLSDASHLRDVPAGWERGPCDGRLVADGVGSAFPVPGCGAATLFAAILKAAALSFVAFPGGGAVSSACSAGTSAKTIANVAINRTADLIVAS
jgi:hypothetical protein